MLEAQSLYTYSLLTAGRGGTQKSCQFSTEDVNGVDNLSLI